MAGKFQSTVLKPTKQRKYRLSKLFAFDIETYDDNKKNSCIALVGDNYRKTFRDSASFKKELMTNYRFRSAHIYATNLTFDFMGIFWEDKDLSNFTIIPRGNTSNIMSATTFVKEGKFVKHGSADDDKKIYSISFRDTMNHVPMGVEALGEMLKIPKIKKPACVIEQRAPRDDEWEELEAYNMRDAIISYEFEKAYIGVAEHLGATFKITTASTTLSEWTNKYLKIPLYRDDEDNLLWLFEGYIGGRTEAFGRGSLRQLMRKYNIEQLYYTDVNSLYPSVMHDFLFPNPNTRRIAHENTLHYIKEFEGMSQCTVTCPKDIRVPLLPFRAKDKILFPKGTFSGRWCHVELRRAMELGYTITHVDKSMYYLETFAPFKEFVVDMYTLRQQYKKEGNKVFELVVKLFSNSLYGKFGQKFFDKQQVVPVPESIEQLRDIELSNDAEVCVIGDAEFVRLSHQKSDPSPFCIPIIASYITSYARLRLYTYLEKYRVVYCDTDSCVSVDYIPTSDMLGDMKLEGMIDRGYIIRSKFYATSGIDAKGKKFNHVKMKGVMTKGNIEHVEDMQIYLENPAHDMVEKLDQIPPHTILDGTNVLSPVEYDILRLLLIPIPVRCIELEIPITEAATIRYTKLLKWKEAAKRKKHVNSVSEVTKQLSFNDEKHVWHERFSPYDWQDGEPITLAGESFHSKMDV